MIQTDLESDRKTAVFLSSLKGLPDCPESPA
jgi:hypothetical protein